MSKSILIFVLISTGLFLNTMKVQGQSEPKKRFREHGFNVGIFQTGSWNAITDVQGVSVGHVTVVQDASIRTGATVIFPHQGNLYQEKVPAGVVLGNGYGKLTGISQILELGEIETPIVLTNTMSVPQGFEAILDWTLAQEGNASVRSVNAVVGETNDGFLNDIRERYLTKEHIKIAFENAQTGKVPEGNVGAGTGTVAFGFKGGIGTSSRVLPEKLGGYTVGVLIQSNYGGILEIMGVPIGKLLGRYYLKDEVEDQKADGSIMVIVATDAPLSDRNLTRLAKRALFGIAKTGSPMTNGSGDYVIAFSTAESVRRTPEKRSQLASFESLPNDLVSPLFQAVVESTEEAIYNALFMAETTSGHRGTIEALPLDKVIPLLNSHKQK